MIFLNPRGGLCNRLRVIGSAIKLGVAYDDFIIVFWRKRQELGCSFEELFESVIYNSSKRLIIKNVDYSEAELIKKIGRKTGDEKIYIDTIADVEKFQRDYIYNNGRGQFLLSTCSSFYNFADKYDWLIPKKEIMEKAEDIVKKFGAYSVGIHIRRTDHEISKRFSPVELFVKIADEEVKKNRNVKFYLATDDMEVKRYFLELYGERIIVNLYQVFSRENKNGMESAVIDLYALSKTQKIYGSFWSSFSQTASAIGNTKIEYVYTMPMKKLLNKKIVIYGAGNLGQVVYKIYFKLCDIVGWIDQNYKDISDSICMEILPPIMISKLNFDYILIAVKKDSIKMEIKQLLLDMNIDSSKIIDEI